MIKMILQFCTVFVHSINTVSTELIFIKHLIYNKFITNLWDHYKKAWKVFQTSFIGK